jgi:glutamate synthase (ferredoxin)
MGCVMMRVCNLDTCPVGVATQNPELRKNFKGKPEYVMNFMRFIAEELREYMARLGVRKVDELVGRTDLLKVKENLTEGQKKIDLTQILSNPYEESREKNTFDAGQVYDFHLERTMDEKVLLKQLSAAIGKGAKRSMEVDVKNTDRAFGTILGSEITRRLGDEVEEDTYRVLCRGAGGQSFGAFIPKGLTLELVGDSNDYFGKGLSGGKLIVYPEAVSNRRRILLSAMWRYMGLPAGRRLSTAWPGSASACVTPALMRWWKAWATMAANI